MTEKRTQELLPPLLFLAAFGVLAWLLSRTVPGGMVVPTSDDGYYLGYMRAVSEKGLGTLPSLHHWYNTVETNWLFPPPSRVGFIAVSALWAEMFGASLRSLQWLSFWSWCACALVNYFFLRRHFGEPRALWIGLSLALSPLLMGLSRLALTDSFIMLCMSLSVWLFLELVQAPASWPRRILFVTAFAWMVLVKELSVLLVVPFAAFVLIERFARREPLKLPLFALLFALPGVIAAPIFVLAAGGIAPLKTTVGIVMGSPATNDYAIHFGSGPWYRYLIDYLCMSPWPALLAIAYFGAIFLRWSSGSYDRRLVFFALLASAMLFQLSFFTKNLRYMVVLELPLRIFAVCMLGELCARLRPARALALCSLAVAALLWMDWQTFQHYWVDARGYDPVSQALLGMRGIVYTQP